MDPRDQPDPWHEPAPEQAPAPEPEPSVETPVPLPAEPYDGYTVFTDPTPPPPPPPTQRGRTMLAWLVIALCTVVIMFLQARANEMPLPPPVDSSPGLDMVFSGRLAVGYERVLGSTDDTMIASMDGQALFSPFEVTDAMRVAVVVGELDGADEAIYRLHLLSESRLSEEYETPSVFRADRDLLLRIYSDEAYVPSEEEAQGLIDRHGWFGEMASGYNLAGSDALHKAPRAAASRTLWIIILFVVAIVLAFLLGFGLMIVFIIMAAMGKLRAKFEPGPLAHGSAYLELVAVFLLGFIVLDLLAALVMPHIGIDLSLPILALMAVPILWPLLCGVSGRQFRQDMGLTAPKGVTREVGAGVVGYFAGLPIVFVGGCVTVVLTMITDMSSEHPAGRDIITGGNYEILLFVIGAVVWAPIVEELVFRAAFYRHLRRLPGWATWLGATVVTSFIFAAIHPQGVIAIPLLMSIAFVLAGLRQWRGSLIAPMAAHALHNGTIATFLIVLIYM